MDKELREIIKILETVFFSLLENPRVMTGCDISEQEIEEIENNNELSLNVLQHVAGDRFFETFHLEIGLSEDEAKEVAEFLYKSAPHFIDELREEFSFLKE